jgi:hypothetical protein
LDKFTRSGKEGYSVKLTDLPSTYRAQFGLDHEADLRPVDGPEVAKAYLAMPHQPEAPLVRASYDVFKRDLEGQYDFLRDNDFYVTPWDRPGQPYSSTSEMTTDVQYLGKVYVFRGGELPADHPLAEPFTSGGLTYNEIFRGVHDIFGHAVEGNPFETFAGEMAAYRAHSRLFSPEAWPALFTETVAQTCGYYFGGREFPDQKAGIVR